MGDCLSCDEREIIPRDPDYDEENSSRASPRELQCEEIRRFLVKAQDDADIGKYFSKLNSYKIEELSSRICVMLNYAFKHQTLTPFEDVLHMHTTMGITEKDVEVFIDLLRDECFHIHARETSAQRKIFKRMKLLIVHGVRNKVRLSIGGQVVWGTLGKVKHFLPLVRRNPILKCQFVNVSEAQMDRMTEMLNNLLSTPNVKNETLVELGMRHKYLFISGVEFDTFIKLWVREHQKDVLFVTKAMPIIDQLRSHFVMTDERRVLDLCHIIKVSRVLGSWARKLEEREVRLLELSNMQRQHNKLMPNNHDWI